MAKIAMLLPSAEMIEPALWAARLYDLDLISLSVLREREVSNAVYTLIESGADIIIARGGQAASIQKITNIPIVEIKISAFEIGQMINEARSLTDKEHPFIALTGPENMFVQIDVARFECQYGIHLKLYYFADPEDMSTIAAQAIADSADVIIGGQVVCDYAQQAGLPFVRTRSGSESILEACRIAQAVGNALDREKEHAASLNLLLDHASSGIIHIDSSGYVLRINSFVEHLLFLESKDILKQPIQKLIPGISSHMLRTVLEKQKEIHARPVKYGRSEFIIHMTPIIVENKVSSAIISFHEGRQLKAPEEERKKELLRRGHTARHTFEAFISRSPEMQKLCTKARHFALFQFPILISGPSGTEKEVLAECIHNQSTMKDHPFIHYCCNGHNPKEIEQMLFSKNEEETDGSFIYQGPCTLYLHEVSDLSLHAQYQLSNLIRNNSASVGVLDHNSNQLPNQIRIILSTQKELSDLVLQGLFLKELYYLISIATLQLPPLSERKEDIMGWVDYQMHGLQEHYGRYMKLTRDAQEYLIHYNWPGNLIELRAVCNRLFINCTKYYVDSADIEKQIQALSGLEIQPKLPLSPEASPSSQEAKELTPRQQILDALHHHEGSREAAAAELGISTTTLWRRMKKYRIPKEEGKQQNASNS